MNLNDLRKLFPVTENSIYLNHSGTSPISTRVRDAMQEFLQDSLREGVAGLVKYYRQCREFKKEFATFIGARPEDLAITLNTSEGLNIVAQGLDWQPGQNVVAPDSEYPANVYPWMNLSDRGVEVRRIPDVNGEYPTRQFEKYMDENTRLVAASFVQFAGGYRQDLEELGQLCEEKGVLFAVDGIQGIGVFPLDVKAAKIHFLSTSTYKWMLGPQGCGLFYIHPDLLDRVKTTWVGSQSVINADDYLDYDLTFAEDASRFEPGTYSTISAIGSRAALGLINELGLDFIGERVLALNEQLAEGVEKKGWKVYGSRKQENRSGILSIYHDEIDSERARQLLLKEKILTTVRGGRLRLAPHCYILEEDIQKAVEILPQSE